MALFNKIKKKKLFPFPKNREVHILETIYAASLLSIVGGYVDAYTFLTRGGVFSYAQTGNIIFLSIGIAKGRFQDAVNCLFPILSFVCGIWFAQYIKNVVKDGHTMEWRYVTLLVNTVILFVVGLLPESFPSAIVVSFISFISAIQITAFNKMEGLPYVTSMCTGNLRSASENLFRFLFSGDGTAMKNGFKYLIVILFFAAGAYLGALFTNIFGFRAVWIPALILLLADGLMFFD